MSTVTNMPRVRKTQAAGRKAQEQLQKIRDRAAPHVAKAVAETKRIGRRVGERLPEDTKLGFAVGRQAGHEAINHGVPYATGAVVGFGFGATEALADLAARPFRALFALGLAAWVSRTGDIEGRCEGEFEVELA